jgi:hypothetical protein
MFFISRSESKSKNEMGSSPFYTRVDGLRRPGPSRSWAGKNQRASEITSLGPQKNPHNDLMA